MIANHNGVRELAIFDNFRVDRGLPKYGEISNQAVITTSIIVNSSAMTNNNVGWGDTATSVPSQFFMGVPTNGNYTQIEKKSFFNKFKFNLKRKPKIKYISIFDFFKGIESNLSKLENIEELTTYYENALAKAKKFGQKALEDRIIDLIDVVKNEINLTDFKFVTEKQIMELYDKTETSKNLKLTWVENFGRIIPDAILKAKEIADEKKIFDNYVILHYDPENNGEALTKKEIEKKKDPILFGVFRKSRKLYYIADWKDEYCDLTLDEMFNTLGDTVGEINNESVKTFIDNIKA